MIAQGIKRWLKSLFAWWPWERSSATDYAQVSGTVVQSTAQETLLFTTAEGPYIQPPQTGITSVAVEPLEEEPGSESRQFSSEAPSFSSKTPLIKPIVDESSNSPSILEEKPIAKQEAIHNTQDTPTPTTEQRLEFLRYLVERGIVNEGHIKKP